MAAVVAGIGRAAGDLDCIPGLENVLELRVLVQQRLVHDIGDLIGPVALLGAALDHHVLLGGVALVLDKVPIFQLVRRGCRPAAHGQLSVALVDAGPGVDRDGGICRHPGQGVAFGLRLVDITLLRHGQSVGGKGDVSGISAVLRRQVPELVLLGVVVHLVREDHDFGVDGGKLLFSGGDGPNLPPVV